MTPSTTGQSSARAYLHLGIAAVLLHLMTGMLRTYDAWFFNDDFQNLAMTMQGHKPLSHMLQSVFGQFVPAYRATNIVFFQFFGLNFMPYLAFLLACSGIAVGCVMWICARIRLPIAATTAIAAFLAFMWLPFEGQSWWSAGLHILPGAATLCACLAIAARPRSTLGLSHSLALAAVYAIGINYYNAVLLVIGPVAAIRWYIRLQEDPRTSFLKRCYGVISDLAPSILMAALAIAAIAWLQGAKAAGTDVAAVSGSVANGAVYGLGAAIGGKLGFSITTPESDLALWGFVGFAIIAGTTLVSILRSPRTAWLWAGCWAFILLQLWIIAAERVPTFGTWVAASPRYNLSNVLMFITTAVMAFGSRYASRSILAGSFRKPATWASGAVAATIVMMHIVTGAAYTAPLANAQARAFVQRLAETAPDGVASVGNRTLPNFLAQHWTGYYASLESFGLIAPIRTELVPWPEATHMIADDGRFIAIATQPTERWTLPGGRIIEPRLVQAFESVGMVTTLQRSNTFTITGWANPLLDDGATAIPVSVTADGKVFTGRSGLPSPDVYARFPDDPFEAAAFRIDMPVTVPFSELRIFFLIDDAIAIEIPRLPGIESVSSIPMASYDQIAGPLVIAGVELASAFSENGWFSGAPPPLSGRAFGSYIVAGDAALGDITLTLDLPPGVTAITVPLLTGPSGNHMRFSVIDPATNAAIATLVDPPPLETWRLWAIDLPPGFASRQIKVRAEDNSAEWGGWLAVGPPHALKPASN